MLHIPYTLKYIELIDQSLSPGGLSPFYPQPYETCYMLLLPTPSWANAGSDIQEAEPQQCAGAFICKLGLLGVQMRH